jgi:hypothetical protein
MGDVTEGPGGVAAAGDSMQVATSLPPPGSGAPVSTSAPPEVQQQWTQAVQQWQAIAGQGQQARKNGAPFYPLGAAHPYGLWAGQVQVPWAFLRSNRTPSAPQMLGQNAKCLYASQPLMYGGPFYSMPFPYPPAASGAQLTGEPVSGAASGVAEKKPVDTNGQSKSGDDTSQPVRCCSTLFMSVVRKHFLSPVSLQHRDLKSTSDATYLQSGTVTWTPFCADARHVGAELQRRQRTARKGCQCRSEVRATASKPARAGAIPVGAHRCYCSKHRFGSTSSSSGCSCKWTDRCSRILAP